MVLPKATIIWINYNSKNILDVVLNSLRGVFELDYPDLEIIIIDNGSTDGSFEIIREFISNVKNKVVKQVKILRLKENFGFITANNLALKLRDRGSRYIVLLNNDAEPYTSSLIELVEILMSLREEKVAGIQGIIATWDKKHVDNMGFIVDELLFSHALYRGQPINTPKKPHLCTFISGAYSVYDIDYLIKINANEKIFDEPFFAYFDDKILGFKAWSKKYKLISYPLPAARHYGSASFRRTSAFKLYLTTRNFLVTLNRTRNHRYRLLVRILYIIRRIVEATLYPNNTSLIDNYISIIRGLIDSYKYTKYLSYEIDLSSIPLRKMNILDVIRSLLSPLQD